MSLTDFTVDRDMKQPDLSPYPATDREKELAERYTRIQPCVIEGEPAAHNAFLQVGAQRFCLTPVATETSEGSSWTCWMAAKALETIIGAEAQGE